jgi:hypothetical protein
VDLRTIPEDVDPAVHREDIPETKDLEKPEKFSGTPAAAAGPSAGSQGGTEARPATAHPDRRDPQRPEELDQSLWGSGQNRERIVTRARRLLAVAGMTSALLIGASIVMSFSRQFRGLTPSQPCSAPSRVSTSMW